MAVNPREAGVSRPCRPGLRRRLGSHHRRPVVPRQAAMVDGWAASSITCPIATASSMSGAARLRRVGRASRTGSRSASPRSGSSDRMISPESISEVEIAVAGNRLVLPLTESPARSGCSRTPIADARLSASRLPLPAQALGMQGAVVPPTRSALGAGRWMRRAPSECGRGSEIPWRDTVRDAT